MPIPTEKLLITAKRMGENARRRLCTRTDAEREILAFVNCYNIAYRETDMPEPAAIELALREFQTGRRARFSADPVLRLPLIFARQ